jgi:hypothetical protein
MISKRELFHNNIKIMEIPYFYIEKINDREMDLNLYFL